MFLKLWLEKLANYNQTNFVSVVQRDMAAIIEQMMLFDYAKRPSVEDLLKTDTVSKLLERRKVVPRINYIVS